MTGIEEQIVAAHFIVSDAVDGYILEVGQTTLDRGWRPPWPASRRG
jgi:hypothetical protein